MTFEDVTHIIQEHGLEIESLYTDREKMNCYLKVGFMINTNALCRWFFVHEISDDDMVSTQPSFGSADLHYVLQLIRQNRIKRQPTVSNDKFESL